MVIKHFSSIDSTNTYLKKHYKELDNYTFISADYQSEGRGRNNRNWISENSKNMLFSLLILDKRLFNHYKEISIIVAYSILKELEKLGINNLMIKWPNDIYVKDKKICGILLESIATNEIDCLIIGIGLNINQKEFIGDYRVNPTSVCLELNKEININQFKNNIYNSIIYFLNDIMNNVSYYNEIIKYDYLKNKKAYYSINNRKELIKIIGIDEDYSLSLIFNNKHINIDNGEIDIV